MCSIWKTRGREGGSDAVEAAPRVCMIAATIESGASAMARTQRERTRQRCVMTTDSEWEMIGALAGRAGLSISRFLVDRALESRDPAPEAEAPSGPPPEVRRRTALAMLVLARIEERRLADAGATAVWDDVVARESAWLDAELDLVVS